MATSPKTPTNPQHAAFPQLFKRTGEARRIKGFRANREMFSRAIRMAKVLDLAPRLVVMLLTGALTLSEAATTLLKEDGGVESLILNGFEIFPAHDNSLNKSIDDFLRANNIGLTQADMFDDDDAEHAGKGSR